MLIYRDASADSSVFWCKILYIVASLIPTALIFFTYAFPKDKLEFNIWQKLLTIFPNVALIFLIVLPGGIISDVISRQGEEKIIVWGQWYPLYVAYITLYFIWPLMVFFKRYLKSSGLLKIQIRYILIGIGSSVLLGSTFNLFLPTLNDFRFNWLGQVSTIIYMVFVTAAITKYHLFEIKLILTEILVGIIAIVLFTRIFIEATLGDKIFAFLLLALFCFFGYYLVRAIHTESKRREEAESVAARERELREEAEVLAADLRRLDAAKNQFLLSTQHHLRSPLSVIQGYLSMIGEGSYGKIPAKAKEKINYSLEANQRLIHLVDELLDVAHFQMNKGAAVKESTDAVGLIAGVIEDLRAVAVAKKLYLDFAKPPVPIPFVPIDARGIREAVYNIVDNAIKYTQTGGVNVSVAVAGDKLRISVKDTGIGMNEKDRQGLFGRIFERGEKAKSVNVEGKGIGLYLATQIIANNGGTIGVESKGWGKGSEFIIDLLMKDSQTNNPPQA